MHLELNFFQIKIGYIIGPWELLLKYTSKSQISNITTH